MAKSTLIIFLIFILNTIQIAFGKQFQDGK